MADVSGQNRPRHITLRVTEEEAAEVASLAAADGSVSAYLRRLVQKDKRSQYRRSMYRIYQRESK